MNPNSPTSITTLLITHVADYLSLMYYENMIIWGIFLWEVEKKSSEQVHDSITDKHYLLALQILVTLQFQLVGIQPSGNCFVELLSGKVYCFLANTRSHLLCLFIGMWLFMQQWPPWYCAAKVHESTMCSRYSCATTDNKYRTNLPHITLHHTTTPIATSYQTKLLIASAASSICSNSNYIQSSMSASLVTTLSTEAYHITLTSHSHHIYITSIKIESPAIRMPSTGINNLITFLWIRSVHFYIS